MRVHHDLRDPAGAFYEGQPDETAWGPYLANLHFACGFDQDGALRQLWSARTARLYSTRIAWRLEGQEASARMQWGTYWLRRSEEDERGAAWWEVTVPDARGVRLLYRLGVEGSPRSLALELAPSQHRWAVAREEAGELCLEVDDCALNIRWEVESGEVPVCTAATGSDGGVVVTWLDVASGGALWVWLEWRQAPHVPSDRLPPSAARDALHRQTTDLMLHGRVVTASPELNRALLWAHTNLQRAVFDYPAGFGASNNVVTDYLVCRDTAWIAMGAVYGEPDWAKELLRTFRRHQRDSGMLVEYVRGVSGAEETYGLAVLDNTPLFLIAVDHVVRVTGDHVFAAEMYPTVRAAAEYLAGLSARDPRGLVAERAGGTANWGIMGWRNVIPGYVLDGAVTEINAQSIAALQAAARVASILRKSADADRWTGAWSGLDQAMRAHLRSTQPWGWLRNVDGHGRRVDRLTGDLVFALLFAPTQGVDDGALAAGCRGLAGPFGIRTIPTQDPEYHPTDGFGLLGGFWPDLTLWWSKALVDRGQCESAWNLFSTVRDLPEAGSRRNAVPGQFPEWFCGASGVNRGMYLSPWVAPKVLWLWMDGFLGLRVEGADLRVQPRLPRAVPWCVWRGVAAVGRRLDIWADAIRQVTYTSVGVRVAEGGHVVLGRDVGAELDLCWDSPDVMVGAYADPEDSGVHLLVGNSASASRSVGIRLAGRTIQLACGPQAFTAAWLSLERVHS